MDHSFADEHILNVVYIGSFARNYGYDDGGWNERALWEMQRRNNLSQIHIDVTISLQFVLPPTQSNHADVHVQWN